MKYKQLRLGDLAEFTTGKLNANKAVEDGKYPFFTTSPETLRINNFAFDQDAILLGGNNANGVFQLKRYTGKFNAYQRTYVISVVKENIINNDYLYYALMPKLVELQNKSLGTATKFITKRILENLLIKVPNNYNEMERRATYLRTIDNKIQLNKQLNANLFELTKNYWELFKSNYKTKYLSISELANKVVTGKTPSKKKKEYYENGNVPFIKIPDMHGRVFVTDSTEHLSTVGANSQKSKFIPKGSIIVSCIGTPGLVAMTSKRCQTNQQINSIIIDSKIVYAVFLELQNLRKYIINLGSGGTTISNLNKSDFQNIKLSVPSIDKMCMFDVEVQPIFQQILSNELENKNLDRIKNELLMKLF
ncbi:hypothetical protein FOL88_00360 [Lactobacillus reuteri]|nr:restriction endonuclease subunit S [Limosilactobacillus reuteri]NMV53492.1 hypothetical protein [Limosilactobacillus reuteri]